MLPEWFEPYVSFEEVADTIRYYNAETVPGLLRTEDYCRAMHRVFSNDDRSTMERRVALRMERKVLLTREEPPAPAIKIIVNESVLRRPVGGREVMRRQLHHLIESTDLPSVSVRVLPFSVGEHAAMLGSFIV